MAKPPKRSRPKLVVSNGDDEIVPATPEDEAPEPMTPKQALFKAAMDAAVHHAINFPSEAKLISEVHMIIGEQWLTPTDRATQRWRRKANETLCQAIETDPNFKLAWERLKV